MQLKQYYWKVVLNFKIHAQGQILAIKNISTVCIKV